MAVICPTVTTDEPHVFREQIEKVALFASRVHIDLADGELAPNKLLDPEKVWWPEAVTADIHLMYKRPIEVLRQLTALKPNLIVLHAEAEGNFLEMAKSLKENNVKIGLALLPHTEVSAILPVLDHIDHVLIFSGDLGHFGGRADLSLLGKVTELKTLNPALEIGWDGGINDQNVKSLVRSGVDVLNTGGYIQRAASPQEAYATLKGLMAAV